MKHITVHILITKINQIIYIKYNCNAGTFTVNYMVIYQFYFKSNLYVETLSLIEIISGSAHRLPRQQELNTTTWHIKQQVHP